MTSAAPIRKPSSTSAPTSSWPRSRSAWASIAPTSATSSTPPCRSRWSITSRRPAAPAAMVWRPSACCWSAVATTACGSRCWRRTAAARLLEAVEALRGRFGAIHVADVLVGAATGRIAQLGHDRLAAYGALRGEKKAQVRAWIDQLMAQGLLARTEDEYPTVTLTERGRAVLRGEAAAPALTSAGAVRATAADAAEAAGRERAARPTPNGAGD